MSKAESKMMDMLKNVQDPWRFLPHTFAAHLSGGKWVPYDYLVLLSHVITAAIAQGNGRILVEIPPRHGKSTFISQWLPAWFLANWPDQNVMLATYETNFATTWGRRTRNLLKEHNDTICQWHVDANGDQLHELISTDSAAAARWTTTMGGGMMTAGVGGPLTGSGGQLLIIDDPHKNWKEAMSPVTKKMIHEWFDSTFYTRCEPDATIIVLHTRWMEDDLIGYLKSQHKDKWLELRMPAIAEEDDPLGRVIGEALCPQRYDEKKLAKIKEASRALTWAGLYQQRPVPVAGNIFKIADWKRYKRAPICKFKIQSWDTGYKKGEESAYTVCQTWGVSELGYFKLDQFRERLEYPQLKKQVMIQYMTHRPHAILIEDRASGQSLIQDFQQSSTLPIIPIPAIDDKVVRAMAVSPLQEAHLLWIPADDQEEDEFINRCAMFPNGRWKDEIDTMSQALIYLQANSILGKVVGIMPRQVLKLIEGYQ
jgi:predicted phage terminase large subunit-like protein